MPSQALVAVDAENAQTAAATYSRNAGMADVLSASSRGKSSNLPKATVKAVASPYPPRIAASAREATTSRW